MRVRLVRGSTTLTISGSSNFAGCTYAPRSPALNEQEITSILQHGGDVTALTRANVVESCTVVVQGADRAAVLVVVRSVETLLPVEEAERMGRAEPLYVEVSMDNGTSWFRSEILNARLEWPDRSQRGALASGTAEIMLIWKRRWYWEDLNELEATNGAVSVDNYAQNGVASNVLTITGSRVQGVIPAATRIVITNNNGAALQVGDIFVGHDVFGGMNNNAEHVIEAEAAGGSTADGTCSGGAYRLFSMGSTWSEVGTYARQLPAGRRFVAFIRLAESGGGFMQLQLVTGGVTTLLREGPQIQAVGLLMQAGEFVWPDLGDERTVAALRLLAKNVNGGNLRVDFIMLMPADSFLWLRTIRQMSYYSIANNDQVVYDGINRRAYLHTYSVSTYAGKQPLVTARGEILLWPGRDQRLYFLLRSMSNGHAIATNLSVRVYYRARRLTL